jgi:hypothetical protein
MVVWECHHVSLITILSLHVSYHYIITGESYHNIVTVRVLALYYHRVSCGPEKGSWILDDVRWKLAQSAVGRT